MRVSRHIAVITARELKRFIAHAPMRASRKPKSIHTPPSFRPLTEAETEAFLRRRLWTALSGARPLA